MLINDKFPLSDPQTDTPAAGPSSDGTQAGETRGRSRRVVFFVGSVDGSVRLLGDLLQLNVTRPAGAGPPSCVVIGVLFQEGRRHGKTALRGAPVVKGP